MMDRMPRFLIATLLLTAATAPLAAQVGHNPESSPYRDIQRSTYLVFTAGQFRGGGGKVGVGPHAGYTYGAQFNLLANRPLQIGLGILYGKLDRLVQDPSKPPETRISGPVSQGVLWTDVAIQFNLTGGKTWHGLAPFLGTSFGLAFSEAVPEDQTGFKMGTKIYLAPMVGTRYFLADRLHLQLDARFQFWQIKYPNSYRLPPSTSPGSPPVLPDGILGEWVVTPWLRAGLGWSFSLPF